MGYIAGGPRAECGVQPSERQDGEECAGYFVEKLSKGAPEPAETLLRRSFGGADGCGHRDSLAHNRRQIPQGRGTAAPQLARAFAFGVSAT